MPNSKFPPSFSDSGNGDDVCVQWPKICVGTKYDFTVEKTEGVTVTSDGNNSIVISLPIKISGSVGFKGDVAKLIKLDKKNLQGALNVEAKLALKLTEDGCPQFDASLSHKWTSEPRIEIVGGVWVKIKDQVEGKLNEKLPELISNAKNAIDCNTFRNNIAAVYGSKSIPVSISSVENVHVNIQPIDIGFSGLKVEPNCVKAVALVNANIEVSNTRLIPTTMTLPKLKTIDAVPPRIYLNVPVRVSYAMLTDAVSHAVVDKKFDHDTAAGKVVVTIKGAEIYPSNGKLVVGLNINADLPSSLLDTQGTIYLMGNPKIENGTKLVFAESNYSQTLDNDFWSLVATLFEGSIRAAITKSATYDLTASIAKTKEELANKLNDPETIPNWKVTLEDADMKLGRIVAADKELAIEALFSTLTTIEPK